MSYIDPCDLAAELEYDDLDPARRQEITDLLDAIGPEARHGVTMIPADEFEDYARELAEDIGALPAEYTWPTSCIDWIQAARELSFDYSIVTFDGEDYYVQG